jgi:parallel beta-helix repeat protein
MKNLRHACFAFIVTTTILSAQETLPPPVEVDVKQGESIQAALDKLPESGGVIRIAPGNFTITEPLVVRTAETRIEGSGASTHIVNKNEEGHPAIHIRPDAYAEDKKARLWRIQTDNFRVSGNEKSGHGIFAQGIQEIFLHGVSIDHHGGHGIFLDFCFEDPRIADCILTYNKESGVHLVGNHDIVVDANHFEENNDALTCLDGFNLTFTGNNIDDHLRHGVVIENTYGSVVTGNMIEECAGTAIILDRDCYGITLSANVIAHDLCDKRKHFHDHSQVRRARFQGQRASDDYREQFLEQLQRRRTDEEKRAARKRMADR